MTKSHLRRAAAVLTAVLLTLLGVGVAPAAAVPTPGVQPNPNPANTTDGYWMVQDNGSVYAFGAASAHTAVTPAPTRAIAAAAGGGYWILGTDGVVQARGSATHFGNVAVAGLAAGEQLTTIAGRPQGDGYWVFTSRGRVFPFGAAQSHGDMTSSTLNGAVIASAATPSGNGYWMVGSDGGIFAFGDAAFNGSMGGSRLNQPVVGIAPDPDGSGYWLVAGDGGIFAFDAGFRGSVPAVLTAGQRLNKPVIGAIAYGDGYLMVASDGGIFAFSDKPFLGSLGADPPATPIVGVAALQGTPAPPPPPPPPANPLASPTLTTVTRTSPATITLGDDWRYELAVDTTDATVTGVSMDFNRPDSSTSSSIAGTLEGGVWVVTRPLNSMTGRFTVRTITVQGPNGTLTYNANGTVTHNPADLEGPAMHSFDFDALGFDVNPATP